MPHPKASEPFPVDDAITRREIEASRWQADSAEIIEDYEGEDTSRHEGGIPYPQYPEEVGRGTPSWMVKALCREAPTSMFYMLDDEGIDRAKRVCSDCEVKAPCLEYALENRIEDGVWGGASESERRRIIKSRR